MNGVGHVQSLEGNVLDNGKHGLAIIAGFAPEITLKNGSIKPR